MVQHTECLDEVPSIVQVKQPESSESRICDRHAKHHAFYDIKVVPLWLKLIMAKILLYSFTLEQEIFTVLIV